ncbi:hypothetical protein HMPREF0863_02441 [Erysipelotrichaceae bacterium 5_2_54FAA]|nr:hypothetical protein HMPREF0863_02441 [Erysipelotrichaceae bacterium 5_2_54FAA]
MQKPIETSEMAIPKISKTAIIALLSFFCAGLLMVNFNWQKENERLQQFADHKMQEAADAKMDMENMQGAFDQKLREVAILENRIHELENRSK